MEAWVAINFDPYEKTASSYYLRAIVFDLALGPNEGLPVAWVLKRNPKDKKRGVVSQLWANFAVEGKQLQSIGTPDTIVWQNGQTLHVAVSWKRNITKLFVDGKEVRQTSQQDTLETDISDTETICVGSRWNNVGFITVDEFRVSSVARQPAELGYFSNGPLKPDRDTILLDHFETLFAGIGQGETKAEVMAAYDNRCGGRGHGACRLVDGKYGKSVALFTPRDALKQQ